MVFSQNLRRFWDINEKIKNFFEVLMFSEVAVHIFRLKIQIQNLFKNLSKLLCFHSYLKYNNAIMHRL